MPNKVNLLTEFLASFQGFALIVLGGARSKIRRILERQKLKIYCHKNPQKGTKSS
jgi:hypothetical protein